MDKTTYNSTTITEELKRRAEVELNEFEATRGERLKELRDILEGVPNLRIPDDDAFLLRFLRPRKFNVPQAAELCKNYFRSRKGKLIGSLEYDFLIDEMEKFGKIGILPFRDPTGCPIAYHEGGEWDPKTIPLRTLMRFFMLEYLATIDSPVTQIAGYKIVGDCTGFGLNQLLGCSPLLLWEAFSILQHSIAGRYIEVHFVNENKFTSLLWKIMGPLMKTKLRSRVYFHSDNYETLHKMIPPELLPVRCGGKLGNYSNRNFVQDLRKLKKRFEELDKFGYE